MARVRGQGRAGTSGNAQTKPRVKVAQACNSCGFPVERDKVGRQSCQCQEVHRRLEKAGVTYRDPDYRKKFFEELNQIRQIDEIYLPNRQLEIPTTETEREAASSVGDPGGWVSEHTEDAIPQEGDRP